MSEKRLSLDVFSYNQVVLLAATSIGLKPNHFPVTVEALNKAETRALPNFVLNGGVGISKKKIMLKLSIKLTVADPRGGFRHSVCPSKPNSKGSH